MASLSSYANLVEELYVAYFGRPADYNGLQNFEAALAAANAPTDVAGLNAAYATNAAVKTLIDSFGTSKESANLYGSSTTAALVTAIFEHVLNRAPAASGLAFWVNAIDSGSVTTGNAALAIAAGAQANSTAQGLIDAQTVANKLAVAINFTAESGLSAASVAAYSGSAAAGTARALVTAVTNTTIPASYAVNVQQTVAQITDALGATVTNLTAGTDTLTGSSGNNIFNAVLDNTAGVAAGGAAATLNAGDSITGGTQNNILNITDAGLGGSMAVSAATITGVNALIINSSEAVSTDFSSWSGLASVNVVTSTGNETVTTASGTTLLVNDASGNVTTNGGSQVSATTDVGHSITVNGGAGTTAVTVIGGNGGTISDVNHGTGKANTITSVTVINTQVPPAYATYAISSDALTSLSLIGSHSGATVTAAAGTRTLALNLDSQFNGFVTDDTATTVNVTTTNDTTAYFYLECTSATSLSFNLNQSLSLNSNGFGSTSTWTNLAAPAAKTVTIGGPGSFYADLSTDNPGSADALNPNATIAATGTGTVQIIVDPTQTFTGGAGRDIVSIFATETAKLTGGSAVNNEIDLDNIHSASTANLANVSHFSVLGVSGSTTGSFDMSKASGYIGFDVQASGGAVSFINVANQSFLSIDSSNANAILLQTADSTGAQDTVTLDIGTGGTSGVTAAQVTLEDSSGTGIGTVNIVSSSYNAASNVVTKLVDTGVVTLNVSGSAPISLGTLAETNLATMTLANDTAVTITGDNVTSGILVDAANDNAAVSFSASGVAASGKTDSVTLGNGNDFVSLAGKADHVAITLGTGSDTIVLGANASGTVVLGTHSGTDAVTVGASGATTSSIVSIQGLNNSGSDTIQFSGDANALTGFTQVTQANVTAAGGDATQLATWVAVADGKGAVVGGAAHGITWFEFGGNTYVVESVAGATADGGTMAAGNTLLELVGTGYTFGHASGAGGVLHMLG
jgi:S-layer protein